MTIDPQVLRSEQHTEVGRIIQRDASLLIQRWAQRAVTEQPHGPRTHHATLLDHLPHFLHTLGESLAESISADHKPHCAPARDHGQQRWENGWSLTEVVRDYQILRLVILDYLEEAVDRPLLFHEVQAIGLALDEAIAASVAAHVRHSEGVLRQQAQALRESDRRKNEFLAVLAHELRNPLAPILSSVEVLRLLGPTDPNVARARDIVERQVKQMARLVDDLLDLTRIAQGKVELRRTVFDLATAVGEAIQTTTPLFESQQHQLSVILPNEPLPLEADKARIVQVLVNLLTNAAKYTEGGGRIVLTGSREGNDLIVRVRDNGVGIEADMLTRIFDLFTQVGSSLHRAQGGLGIGLTLVRQLVEMHGGHVAVHSDGPGQGSEFAIWLPARAPASPTPQTPSRGKEAVSPCRILLVEDSSDARTSLQTLLTLLGHQVEVAANGPDGVARALALKPQVALIDLGLPGMDGYEVARQLRAGLGASVQLVALTGHGLDEDRRRTKEAGFNAHLVKPVEIDELNQLLIKAAPAAPAAG